MPRDLSPLKDPHRINLKLIQKIIERDIEKKLPSNMKIKLRKTQELTDIIVKSQDIHKRIEEKVISQPNLTTLKGKKAMLEQLRSLSPIDRATPSIQDPSPLS